MNTTHTKELTEQKGKPLGNQLLDQIDLRDYFAAKAMQGMMISAPKEADEVIAELAYTMADAMLKAREA